MSYNYVENNHLSKHTQNLPKCGMHDAETAGTSPDRTKTPETTDLTRSAAAAAQRRTRPNGPEGLKPNSSSHLLREDNLPDAIWPREDGDSAAAPPPHRRASPRRPRRPPRLHRARRSRHLQSRSEGQYSPRCPDLGAQLPPLSRLRALGSNGFPCFRLSLLAG